MISRFEKLKKIIVVQIETIVQTKWDSWLRFWQLFVWWRHRKVCKGASERDLGNDCVILPFFQLICATSAIRRSTSIVSIFHQLLAITRLWIVMKTAKGRLTAIRFRCQVRINVGWVWNLQIAPKENILQRFATNLDKKNFENSKIRAWNLIDPFTSFYLLDRKQRKMYRGCKKAGICKSYSTKEDSNVYFKVLKCDECNEAFCNGAPAGISHLLFITSLSILFTIIFR